MSYLLKYELEGKSIGNYIQTSTYELSDDDYNYLKSCEYNLDTALYIEPGYKIEDASLDYSYYGNLEPKLQDNSYTIIYRNNKSEM